MCECVYPDISGKTTGVYKILGTSNHLVIRGFCYIRPINNEVPLYSQYVDFEPHNADGIKATIVCYIIVQVLPQCTVEPRYKEV